MLLKNMPNYQSAGDKRVDDVTVAAHSYGQVNSDIADRTKLPDIVAVNFIYTFANHNYDQVFPTHGHVNSDIADRTSTPNIVAAQL